MRFKRLRVVVAIVLAIFVLFVANTLAFGWIKEKFYVAPDSKKDSGVMLTLHDDAIVASETSTATPSKATPSPVAPSTPPPVTTHTTRKTRAS